MSSVVAFQSKVPAMTSQAIAKVCALEARMVALPQVEISTHHVLHGGMYARTIMLPAGCMLAGALIKVPTTLTINGDCHVFLGEEIVQLTGYNVIPASAGRKQAFVANSDTVITMTCATNATTIEQVEEQITDDYERLMSRQPDAINKFIITGE